MESLATQQEAGAGGKYKHGDSHEGDIFHLVSREKRENTHDQAGYRPYQRGPAVVPKKR